MHHYVQFQIAMCVYSVPIFRTPGWGCTGSYSRLVHSSMYECNIQYLQVVDKIPTVYKYDSMHSDHREAKELTFGNYSALHKCIRWQWGKMPWRTYLSSLKWFGHCLYKQGKCNVCWARTLGYTPNIKTWELRIDTGWISTNTTMRFPTSGCPFYFPNEREQRLLRFLLLGFCLLLLLRSSSGSLLGSGNFLWCSFLWSCRLFRCRRLLLGSSSLLGRCCLLLRGSSLLRSCCLLLGGCLGFGWSWLFGNGSFFRLGLWFRLFGFSRKLVGCLDLCEQAVVDATFKSSTQYVLLDLSLCVWEALWVSRGRGCVAGWRSDRKEFRYFLYRGSSRRISLRS